MKKIANDLGYGSIKVSLDGERMVYPSVIAIEREQDILAPVEFGNKSEKDKYMDDFLNRMDVTISSSAVKMQGRFLIGNAAISSGLQPRAFDINALSGKADSDLSLIFTLSMIAGQKVKEAYKDNNDLTKPLSTEVTLITALPVKEGKKRDIKDNYKKRYLNKTHQVTFHNFADPITVTVKFKAVYVANEGETAALYIASGEDEELTAGLKADLDSNYPELKDEVSANDIIQAQNIIVLDIGGGTVDIIIIVNGKVIASASLSMNEGYDNALDEAVEFLQDNRYNFKDRTDLKEYLEQPASGLNKKRHQAVEDIVYAQLEPFCDRIVDNVSKAAGKSRAGFEEVITVGGGSIPMKDHSNLRNKLVNKMKDFNGGFIVPVLFVPKEKAQTLNLYGLEYIGKHVS
ncbi:ParM/StbA family protein [Limosilactobacillus reuteri]|uniref:ParM/StbA family protein n=1 Tax=Limosilactobacillus reuteri TaxID=1598 RepID=UPI001E622B7F|nr:ParM/StbA family protein [Limosilactobacillus reuteri]MCC4370505.1 ParM/StbA family protein [Limosilactobacillus reuteri]MCC4509440.1 ParM/StbA family protein [Limosilactobacillus reuteri]